MSEISSAAGVGEFSVSSPVQILQTLGITRGDSGALSFSKMNTSSKYEELVKFRAKVSA